MILALLVLPLLKGCCCAAGWWLAGTEDAADVQQDDRAERRLPLRRLRLVLRAAERAAALGQDLVLLRRSVVLRREARRPHQIAVLLAHDEPNP